MSLCGGLHQAEKLRPNPLCAPPPSSQSMWNVSYERAPMSVSIRHSAVNLRVEKKRPGALAGVVYVAHTQTVAYSNNMIVAMNQLKDG